MYTENMFGYVKMPDGAITPLGDMVAKGIADATGKVWRNTPDTSTDIRKFYHEYLSARNALAEMMPRLQMADQVPVMKREIDRLKGELERHEMDAGRRAAAAARLRSKQYGEDQEPVSVGKSAEEYMSRHRKEPLTLEGKIEGNALAFLTSPYVKERVERG